MLYYLHGGTLSIVMCGVGAGSETGAYGGSV